MTRRPIRVLFIEDSRDDCELTLRALAANGRPITAWRRISDRAELPEALGADEWDLVFVDWRIPGWSGEQALEDLRAQRGPVPPAIVLSASMPAAPQVARASELGAAAFTEKWDRGDELASVVDRVLLAAGDSLLERTAADLLAYPELAMAILEAMPDGIFAVNTAGVIRVVNQQAQLISGYHRSELLAAPIEAVLPEPVRGVHRGHRARYSRDPRQRAMGAGAPLRLRRKDGEEISVNVMLVPVMAVEGLLTLAVVRRAES